MRIAFTERELDVMAILWEHGPSTAGEVREHLADDLAYNTVLTVIRTLEAKGFVRHEGEGKAHRYFPRVKREANAGSTLARVLKTVFQDSPELLLTHLVQERRLSDDELKRLRKLLDHKGGKR